MEGGGWFPKAGVFRAAVEVPPCRLQRKREGPAGPAGPDGAHGPRRVLRAVYVSNESPNGGAAGGPEAGAWQCLLRACEAEGVHLTSVPFEELHVEETAVLDAFCDAGEAGALRPTPPTRLLALLPVVAPALPVLVAPHSFHRSTPSFGAGENT